MLLLFFTHAHLTVTVTLGLLLIPKVKATTACLAPFHTSRPGITWLTLIHTGKKVGFQSILTFASD